MITQPPKERAQWGMFIAGCVSTALVGFAIEWFMINSWIGAHCFQALGTWVCQP